MNADDSPLDQLAMSRGNDREMETGDNMKGLL
jgi:hypothetical protein